MKNMKRNNIEIIECSGTSYEIGQQYGQAAKSNILESVNLVFNALENGPFKASRNNIFAIADQYLRNAREFDQESCDFVKGIADGSGLSFQEVFALRCFIDMIVGYPALAALCTSFAATRNATKDRITILGQNIDWHPDSPIDLLHIRHADGLEQLSLCLCGNNFYYLNSAGIGCCANMTISPLGPIKKHIPVTFYLWKAMRRKTINDAMKILRDTARGVGYYHLADQYGNMAGIESIYDDYRILNPQNDTLIHANHYETDDYKKSDGAYVYLPDSFGRAQRMRELITNNTGNITPELMMKIMSDHEHHPKSICTHVDHSQPPELASISRASFIMIPEQLKMYVAFGPPCENQYHEYSLRK